MEPIQSNKIYPIGIQNFEKMRKGGYFYVDKTALVYRLVTPRAAHRPEYREV